MMKRCGIRTIQTAIDGMNEDWARLCRMLDDDPQLVAAVSQAADDPWSVMIDGLDDAGALAYLEPGDTGAQLADALAGLPRIFATAVDLDSIGDVDSDLTTAVAVANEMLDEHGLALVYLEEEPDAYPLVAVAADDAEEIVALAGRLGHVARTH
jgi:hypothetical protein